MAQVSAPVTSNWNVPNSLSVTRLFLAIIVCILIELQVWLPAMICFLIAASTDWVDGWWARKFNQVTKLGRILDPFVDKVIICGAMIALCAAVGSAIAPWMATLVVARELLVTSLRGMVEGSGGDFSAKQLGKWKMVAQCAAIVSVLMQLQHSSPPSWLQWSSIGFVWIAITLTVLSGLEYVLLVLKKPS
jgi:CDP-diacylglycerol---glycerol-3-phosphate 3-phosphatidyltransferase